VLNPRAILGNAAWLMLEKILRVLVGVFVSAWVARYLGPERFGALNYALALVAIFAVLANAGLDRIVVRDIAREPEQKDVLLGSAFAIKVGGGLAALACALVAGVLLSGTDALLPWLVLPAALALVFLPFDTVDLWFQSQLKARVAVMARNAVLVAMALVRIALVLAGAPLWAFAWAVFLDGALTAAALAAAYRMQRARLSAWRCDAARFRSLLREGWPLILASLMVSTYVKIDQVMLGAMAGAEAVGVYAAAVSLSEPWYFVPVAIVMSVAPALARHRDEDPALYEKRFIQLFRALLLVSVAMALPLSLAADPLVALLFGDNYRGAGPVLTVHVWAVIFVAWALVGGQYLVLEGLTRITLHRTALGALINVALNLLWIPRYGALGCAWATLISYAAVSFFMFQTPATRRCLGWMLRALAPGSLRWR
jgi:PST family polysaccharide transporter